MNAPTMKKIFVNRNHFLYFALLILATIWLAALHWAVNPYKLSVWISASHSGSISIESRCESQGDIAQKNSKWVFAGYMQYELPLPKCRLSTIKISSSGKRDEHYEISSAAVTYYGKEAYRLLGTKRTLEGEGLWRGDYRPSRTGATELAPPLVLNASDFNASDIRIWWPRFLPLFLFPFVWWFARMLASRRAGDPEKNGDGRTFAFFAVAAFLLIAAMALVAKTDVSVHPDELTHVASARYYYDHWLKPKIGDPETLDAHRTNVYGVAYLTGTDPVYQLASKFAVAAWPIFENDVLALRMFNVVLFGVLAFLAFMTIGVRLALIPLLATPQVWYVFSYFNGDALPVFLSVLAIVAFARLSNLDELQRKYPAAMWTSVFAGGLAGMLLLSKPNYWSVIGVIVLLLVARTKYLTTTEFSLAILGWILILFGMFFFLDSALWLPSVVRVLPILMGSALLAWAVWRFFRQAIAGYTRGSSSLRLVSLALIGLTMVMGIKMLDETWKNPPPFSSDRAAAMTAVTEETADAQYKPSAQRDQNLAKGHKLHDQGTSLKEMLFGTYWISISMQSFIGVYGYMNIQPPNLLANILLLTFFMFVITVFALVERSTLQSTPHALVLSQLVGMVTVVAASIAFSWIVDFQAQGRYLLAILPIAGGGLVFAGPGVARSKILHVIITVAFLLSAVSFVFIGMQGIPKQAGLF